MRKNKTYHKKQNDRQLAIHGKLEKHVILHQNHDPAFSGADLRSVLGQVQSFQMQKIINLFSG